MPGMSMFNQQICTWNGSDDEARERKKRKTQSIFHKSSVEWHLKNLRELVVSPSVMYLIGHHKWFCQW